METTQSVLVFNQACSTDNQIPSSVQGIVYCSLRHNTLLALSRAKHEHTLPPQAVLAHTPKSHPDYPALKKARKEMKEVVHFINEAKRVAEAKQKVIDLWEAIDDEGGEVRPHPFTPTHLKKQADSHRWNYYLYRCQRLLPSDGFSLRLMCESS